MNKSIVDIIKERSSWRTYRDYMPLENEKIALLTSFFSKCTQGPFGSHARFKLINGMKDDPGQLRDLGTYGFIHGASSFVIGAVKKNRYDLEDFGYLFEQIILFITRMGLGSCWLGGTFNKSAFAKKMDLSKYEFIPAVSPVGHKKVKRGLIDSAVRFVAGSKNRKPWNEIFYLGDFSKPLSPDMLGGYQTVLEMVRLAPSASNRQPWRIVRDVDKNIFHFYMKRSLGHKTSSNSLGIVDLQRVDMGIAMCHFDMVVSEMQLKGSWKVVCPQIEKLPAATSYLVSWVEDTI